MFSASKMRVNRLPFPIGSFSIGFNKKQEKKRTKEEHTVTQLIADESQKHLAAAVPGRSSSLCCHWFSSPRSAGREMGRGNTLGKKKKKREKSHCK